MSESLTSSVIDAVRAVVGSDAVVGLHEPDIGEVEHRMVRECLDSTFVSSVGPFVTRFEQEIAEFTGSAHAIAVSNGTSALQVALFLAGVERDDEVLVPALSFIATANAVVHLGAVPHFIDSNPLTMGLDADALRTALEAMTSRDGRLVNPVSGRRVAAIVPMHTLGHPTQIADIMDLSREFGVPVVEDAAESLGSSVGGKHTGTFGLLGVLSFNGNKTITTGGGGMILTDDAELGRRAKSLTTTAKLPHEWEFEHEETAWNFRMPNLNAAMGVAQLTKLDTYLSQKHTIAERYAEAFSAVDGLSFVPQPAGTISNYWLCAVRLDEPDIARRDELLRALNDDGVRARPFWNLLSDQRMYQQHQRGDLTVARSLLNSVISLPSSPKLANRS